MHDDLWSLVCVLSLAAGPKVLDLGFCAGKVPFGVSIDNMDRSNFTFAIELHIFKFE